MRIQLLSINFAPEKTGIAPYSTALAKHLSVAHDVTVITGRPHYPEWTVAPEHRAWRTEFQDGDLRVVRVGHYVPRRPTLFRRLAYELSWSAHAALVGSRIPTDLVIAVVPALFAAHAARGVAAAQGAKTAVIVHDVMSAAATQSGTRHSHMAARIVAMTERCGMRKIDAVATIHPRLASDLGTLLDSDVQPTVIYNWTHLAPTPLRRLRADFGWADDETIVLHSGNMGVKQNLEVVVDAARLAAAEGRRVLFVLAGNGSQRRALERYSADCPTLSFFDLRNDDDYLDMLRAADVLLVNERPGMQSMSVPSKLTSYMTAARPIVAATEEHGATAEFVRASGSGVITAAGDPHELLDAIERVVNDRELSDKLARCGAEFAKTALSERAAFAAYDSWIASVG